MNNKHQQECNQCFNDNALEGVQRIIQCGIAQVAFQDVIGCCKLQVTITMDLSLLILGVSGRGG